MSEEETLEARVGFLVPLNKLPPERQSKLLEQSEVLKLKKKQTLFKQGDRDDYTFYVLEGDMEMYADDSLIKAVSGGDGASFQPLAQLQPRQMTAIAKTKAQVLRVNRALLEQLLSMDVTPPADEPDSGVEVEEMEVEGSGDWLMTMLQSELFSRIPASNIQNLLDTLETVEAKQGEVVVKQGEPGDYYYALQSGSCEVVRAGRNKKEVRLAELTAGDTFGEEALISGGKRNATVRMTSDGNLARLTKDDFTKLIKAPLLSTVTREEADKLAADGALWLDVRFEDEHDHNGLPKSLNIPLSSLRTRMDELIIDLRYIAYCDSGGRSSAAAFLLAEKGYNVVHVEGGAVDEPKPEAPAAVPDAEAPAKKAPAKKKAAAKKPAKEASAQKSAAAKTPAAKPSPEKVASEAALEADARASSLSAEVEKAAITIEQARTLMAEAEAMKAEVEKFVADRLASEKQKIEEEAEVLQNTLAAEKLKILQEAEELQQTLASEKEKIEKEAAAVKLKMVEAERLKDELAEQLKSAEIEAEKRHQEVETQLEEMEKTAEERFAAEEKRLEALYAKQAELLETTQADREAELRAQLQEELAQERRNFEAEFARTAEELEKVREEREAALAAQKAAAEEARSMIEEFKAQQEELLAEQYAAIKTEREKLQSEAARISKLQEETAKARYEAEAAKVATERELEKARAEQAAETSPEVDTTIIEIEERAVAADLELEQAIEAESVVATAAKGNEDELERTYDTANEINILLKKELTDWVDDQDQFQESTLQREVLSRQKEMVERIKARAAAAQAESINHDKSLLEEIEAKLSGE